MALFLGISPASIAAPGDGPPDKYDFSIWTETAGVAGAPETRSLCRDKALEDVKFIPLPDGCTIKDVDRIESTLSYKATCTGDDPRTVEGEIAFGPTKFLGSMRMIGDKSGTTTETLRRFTYVRTGECR